MRSYSDQDLQISTFLAFCQDRRDKNVFEDLKDYSHNVV